MLNSASVDQKNAFCSDSLGAENKLKNRNWTHWVMTMIKRWVKRNVTTQNAKKYHRKKDDEKVNFLPYLEMRLAYAH